MKVLLLSQEEIKGILTMSNVIKVMEEVFKAKALGKTLMPPKIYVSLERYKGDFRAMPAYLEYQDIAGVKIVNAHPENPIKYGLPTVMATILLLDPKTGSPIAIFDGTHITNMRTGAVGGVAARYLARKDSRIVGMVGAGTQARTQLMALKEVMKIDEVRVSSLSFEKSEKFAKEMSSALGLNVIAKEKAEVAVRGCDILVTTTPSVVPVVMNEWVKEGTHINAIGADAPGKEELDPEILKRAKIIVDDYEQAYHSGEINVPLSQGVIRKEDVYAELGEILIGKKPGRISDSEITIFDSTGLAIQDVATAWIVYQEAKKRGLGKEIEL